jgi:hypothetical protein
MESHMFKSNTRFLTIANVILAAIPLVGLFAAGFSSPGPMA